MSDLGASECYFFPTGIYDWWLTQPQTKTTTNKHGYEYIPGYVDLLFYKDADSFKARRDYFHFVKPNYGNVAISDITFLTEYYCNNFLRRI